MCQLEYIKRIRQKYKWLWNEKQHNLDLETYYKYLKTSLEQIEVLIQEELSENNLIYCLEYKNILTEYKQSLLEKIDTTKILFKNNKSRIKYYQQITKIYPIF